MPFDLLIHTRRLLLRPLQMGDVGALFGIFGDPSVMRFWSTPPWESEEPGRAMVAQDLAAQADADDLRLGLVRQEDGALIGTCTLFGRQRQSRRAEIGYALAQSAWGLGYMHEALSALLDHGFNAWQLNRVEADIDPRNQASARALERLGFRREGLLRERWIVNGQVSDTLYYGLLRSDWRTAAPTVQSPGAAAADGTAPQAEAG
jgi:[ribosomal protein S5]-alanine N-acetyltransferase